jgi:Sec-independent protein translocase protein TatA
MMFQQPFFLAFILLSFGGCSCCCEAATTPEQDVISDDEDAGIVQYKISRFGIVLEPTMHTITDELVASFLSPVIEATLFDALGGKHTQSTYVLLTPAFVEDSDRRRQLSTTSDETELTNSNSNSTTISTTIIVKGGLVNFRTQPPTEEVLGVIRAGINENLVGNLPGNSAFQGITIATFLDLKDKEEMAPPVVVSPNTNGNDKDDGNSEQPPSSISDVLFVVFGTTGLLLILSGLVLLNRRMQKERNQEERKSLKDISFETQGTNDTTSQQEEQQQQQQPDDDDDNKSVNSEWTTVPTETENKQSLAKSHYLAAKESFERNSLMGVKKDMLQSEWSTYHPSNSGSNSSNNSVQQLGEMQFQAASEHDHHKDNTQGIV